MAGVYTSRELDPGTKHRLEAKKIVNYLPGMIFGSFEEQRGVRIISLNPIQGVGGADTMGEYLGKNRRTNTNLGGEKQVLA